MVSESLKSTEITLVAAPVTCRTSNVNFEMRLPLGVIVVIVGRQADEIREHGIAQIHHDLVRHPADRVVGEI